MDPTPLQGKCAIVTGGSRGIGQGIAIELAKRGVAVLIAYVSSAEGASKTVLAIRDAGGRALAMQADSRQAQESASKIVAHAIDFSDGHIDIIVNNAADGSMDTLDGIDTAMFDRVMHTNALFPLLLVKACHPYLRKGTRVVNISTVAARLPDSYVYSASKAALESITRSLARELGRSLDGTVNAVNPSPVATGMWVVPTLAGVPDIEKTLMSITPAGDRMGQVDDIAPIVAFLCDPSA